MAGCWKRVGLSVGLLGLAIGTGWTGDASIDLIRAVYAVPWSWHWSSGAWGPLVRLLAGGGLLLGSAWGLFRMRHGLIVSRARLVSASSSEIHTIIMGVSTRQPDQIGSTGLLDQLSFSEAIPDREDLKRHPWQQNLRMVWHCLPQNETRRLKRIYLVPSQGREEENQGDRDSSLSPLIDEFSKLLKKKLRMCGCRCGDIEIYVHPVPVNYESLDAVSEAINTLINKAKKKALEDTAQPRRRGLGRSGICVDVTSGTKTYSIAAAIMTMNCDLIFGYIDNNGSPKFYDGQVEVLSHFSE